MEEKIIEVILGKKVDLDNTDKKELKGKIVQVLKTLMLAWGK